MVGNDYNPLFNRLRTEGRSRSSLGWAMVLQRAGGFNHIADAVARHSQGVFVLSLADVDEVDETQTSKSTPDGVHRVDRPSFLTFVRKATADGVIDGK